jgi:hypothetical protein
MLSSLEIRRSKFAARKQTGLLKPVAAGVARFSFAGVREHGRAGFGIPYSGFFRISAIRLSHFRILFRACYA